MLAALMLLGLVACDMPAAEKQEDPAAAETPADAPEAEAPEAEEPADAEAPKADAEAPGEPVTVVMWHTLTDHHQAALDEIIEKFNASQDRYKVVAEQQPYSEFSAKLLQAVSSGTGPDFTKMFASDAVNYIEEGYLYDFAPLINDPEIGTPDFKDQIVPGLYEEITQWDKDKIYMIPRTYGSEVLFYNKTWFDELGLDAPTTWTEVEEASKAIYEKYGVAGFGTDSITDTFTIWMMQGGSDYIDVENKTVAIDRDLAIEKLNWFAKGVQEGYFRLVGEDKYFSNPFGSKAVGMYIGSAAGYDYFYAAIPEDGEGHFELGVCPVPQEGPEKYISNFGNTWVCLARDDEHARGAYEFITFMNQKENAIPWAMAYGALPARKEAVEDPEFQKFAEENPAIKALTEEYMYIGHLPSIPGSNTMRTEIDKIVQSVALGVQDAETAFDNFVATSNAAMQE